MVLRSKHWLSSAVLRDEKVREAVNDIRRLARRYRDAGSPALSQRPRKLVHSFLAPEVGVFRPSWVRFSGVVVVFAVSGLAYAWAKEPIDAVAWVELALKVVVPIFVLGISVASLTRALSEAGRFTGEYLNEACRMPLFCCLTFLAGIMAFAGWLMAQISWFHPMIATCVAAGSVGAGIASFAMLAFVIRETIRCLVPGQAVKIVSRFAAAKLCYAYLKEVYVRLSQSQYNAYLEKWCVEHCKAIHPPSQYYGYFFRSGLGSDKRSDSCEIALEPPRSGDASLYKDFHLGRLEELERYLSENNAELYLSSPQYESEQGVFGVLSSPGVATNGPLSAAVESMGYRAVRCRSMPFAEEGDEFWESQQSALSQAIQRAVERADPLEVRAYLDAVNMPLRVLRRTRQHRVVRDAYGEYIRRGYDFLRLYLVAIDEMLASQEHGHKHRIRRTSELARELLKSVWEEARSILRDVDYHTIGLFTWLIPQVYRTIQEADEKAGPLRGMRAEFGGFYTFADGWLEDEQSRNARAVEQIRLVLHDGLTKWLLMSMEQKDRELTEQLCDAARTIVFGREGDITFDRCTLVACHFVLGGHLIGRAAVDDVKATAIEHLFFERDSREPHVDFDDLATFYRGNPYPPRAIESYLRIFSKPDFTATNLLTGSSHSFGSGMSGLHEMALAFIYVGASALTQNMNEPQILPVDMSFELDGDAMKTVANLFKGAALDCGLERLKAWRDKCKESSDEADAKAIADAALDPSKKRDWRNEFWNAYVSSSPVLSLCLRNGNYEIVDSVNTSTPRYLLPKIAVIDWRYPIGGASGRDYARGLARHMEGQLLAKMAAKTRSVSQVDGTLSDLMRRAVAWLNKAGCEGEKGIIVVVRKRASDSELFYDNSYVPSWRENVESRGFKGFYDGFPVVWHKENEGAEEGEQERKVLERECVVAVDLRGWKGVNVSESVVTEKKFGELTIRTWTQDEIQTAIKSGKLKPEDENRARGNCPVDITLHWELSSSRPPHRRTFQIQGSVDEALPADKSQPTEQ